MYKGLLGDCFLLTCTAAGAAKPTYVLIDCGMLQGIQGGADRMKKVAQDIRATTGGHLHLVIVTHRHFDHISGFQYGHGVFFAEDFGIDELWLGWPENDADPQARQLWGRAQAAAKAVQSGAAKAAQLAAAGNPAAEAALAGLDAFLAPSGATPSATAVAAPAVLGDLKRKAKAVKYLAPGEAHPTSALAGMTAYVLGPPRSERLFDSDPSAGPKAETYVQVDGLNAADDQFAFFDPSSGPESPFPAIYRHELAAPTLPADPEDLRAWKWFSTTYLDGPAARRIDDAAFGGIARLALRLDRNINNTSLCLAFETAAGRTLLFPGDAQVGNWLSWGDQSYPACGATRTIDDLLGRVAFYKVGHHASRNATLDARGLEKMSNNGDLVAMIPLVEKYAHGQAGGGWDMPYPNLYRRLLEQTEGRVLRGDAKAGFDAAGEVLTADRAFLDRVCEESSADDLWVEYDLPPGQLSGSSASPSEGAI